MRIRPKLWVSVVILALGAALLLVFITVGNVERNKNFVTTFYTLRSDEAGEGFRIVELADLHLHEYGADNTELIERIGALKPDLIALAGDMTLAGKPYAPVLRLIEQLSAIAPVYYSAGNNEMKDILNDAECSLIADVRAAGAVYLDNAYEKIELNGTAVAVGGICKNRADILKYTAATRMIAELSAEDCFTLLLSHYPEGFIGGKMDAYPFDLVLCGHAHGGQVRLPKTDGLYSTDQGFFPRYTSGLRTMSGSNVVISRGLGDSGSLIPRINNVPELVVIDVE